MRVLALAALVIAAYLSPATTLVGVLAGLLLGLHIGGRHAIRRTGVGMVRGGSRRILTGRL